MPTIPGEVLEELWSNLAHLHLRFRRWIEMVAAIKLATLNRKGRHLSTAKAIALAEDGVYLEGRFEHIPKGP